MAETVSLAVSFCNENHGPCVRGQIVGRLLLGKVEGQADAQAPRIPSLVVIASEFVAGNESCDVAREALSIAC